MIHTDTAVVLFSAGVIFLWALILGVWKWRAMVASPVGLAHRYVDIAHRSALMYAFATGLIAPFVELSDWPPAVNRSAAAAIILMFVVTISNYIRLGVQRTTDNQMRNAPKYALPALVVLEIGGFGVLLAGFAAAQL